MGIYGPGGKYGKIMGGSTVNELFNFYSSLFRENLDDASYNIAEGVFREYGSETYDSIQNKVIKAEETLNSKATDITEEEKTSANAILTKYEKIMNPISRFEDAELDKISNPVKKDALKKDLSEMFKPN